MPVFEERLRQLGSWLSTNGEAIYETRSWKYQNDTYNPDVWYTKKANNVYAILLKYPSDSKVQLYGTVPSNVTMLGYSGIIQWVQAPAPKNPGIIIDLSDINVINTPSQWAWVFKLENAS